MFTFSILHAYTLPFSQAIVDLLIPGKTPGIKETLVDLYGKPELLFFGPDGQSLLCLSSEYRFTFYFA